MGLRTCLSLEDHSQELPALPRVISRAQGLKLVVETLMSSLKPIGNIVVICCAFFIIFGILGVQVCRTWVPGLGKSQQGSPLASWVLSLQQPLPPSLHLSWPPGRFAEGL